MITELQSNQLVYIRQGYILVCGELIGNSQELCRILN